MFKVGDKVRIRSRSFSKIGDYIGVLTDVMPYSPYPIYVQFKNWAHWFRADELEIDQHEQVEMEIQEQEPEKTPEEIERERLRNFFFGSSPELPRLAKQRKADGKCPVCGEDGRIHLSTFVCSKHGTY